MKYIFVLFTCVLSATFTWSNDNNQSHEKNGPISNTLVTTQLPDLQGLGLPENLTKRLGDAMTKFTAKHSENSKSIQESIDNIRSYDPEKGAKEAYEIVDGLINDVVEMRDLVGEDGDIAGAFEVVTTFFERTKNEISSDEEMTELNREALLKTIMANQRTISDALITLDSLRKQTTEALPKLRGLRKFLAYSIRIYNLELLAEDLIKSVDELEQTFDGLMRSMDEATNPVVFN